MLRCNSGKVIFVAVVLLLCAQQTLSQPDVAVEKVPLANLESVNPGDAFVFWMRFPKSGFLGYRGPSPIPSTRIPKDIQDYNQRMLRICILSVEVGAKERVITARIDEVDVEHQMWVEGRYKLALQLGDNNINVISEPRNGTPAIFPFSSYPSVAVLDPTKEGKQRIIRQGEVVEESYGMANDKKWIPVEVQHLDVVQNEPEQLALRFVDVMKWDIGSPFFNDLIRRDAEGHMMFECIMVGKETAPTPDDEK